jgi:hydroxymethylpyrimidine/phosphomethylpyrimidine kinase
MRVALTIAGSDPSGGAGIQADLKTFSRFEVFGASALTLVTAQNTVGVSAVHLLPTDLVAAQLEAVLQDLPVHAVKTGALGSAAMVAAVAQTLALSLPASTPLVIDPVMISKHGHSLIDDDAVDALRALLLPRATLLTPNIHEAARLLGRPILTLADLPQAARDLCALGPRAVVIKGGALGGDASIDHIYDASTDLDLALRAPRVQTRSTHGTGCTFSAAITARLALGDTLPDALTTAKAFLTRALIGAPGLGHGVGPLNHFV